MNTLRSREHEALLSTEMIYLDHATTSCPKAPGVVEAMADTLNHICASPSRAAIRWAI